VRGCGHGHPSEVPDGQGSGGGARGFSEYGESLGIKRQAAGVSPSAEQLPVVQGVGRRTTSVANTEACFANGREDKNEATKREVTDLFRNDKFSGGKYFTGSQLHWKWDLVEESAEHAQVSVQLG
jgi:hypothetical protein